MLSPYSVEEFCGPSSVPEPPCDACESPIAVDSPLTPPTPSKAARRQQRMKRTIMKSLCPNGEMLPPPGLDCDDSISVDAPLTVIDLQRRVQRLELLLFRAPVPMLEKFDRYITSVLHSESDRSDLGVLEEVTEEHVVPEAL